jgi:uncharacterized protein (DUF302 family)
MTNPLHAAVAAARRMTLGLAAAGVVAAGLGLAATAGSAAAGQASAAAPAGGVIRVPSAHPFDDTVARLKADIAAKGIQFFAEIDQARLAADAETMLRPSTLLLFGNPPLGVQFLTANPYAGLDWPVRMLVIEDQDGKVWVAYSDFAYIADRYAITDRDAAFAKAAEVAASIAASASGASGAEP